MEKLPVIEVSEDNFVSVLPAIRDAISKASFVAIDCELSGLGQRKKINYPEIDFRYQYMAEVARKYAVVSLGLSCFTCKSVSNLKIENNEGGCGQVLSHDYLVQTFNFITLCSDDFTVECNSFKFLERHGFDFNKLYAKGLQYYKGCDKEKEENPNIRHVLSSIVEHRKPVVVHNGLLDLVYLYQAFYAELPKKSETFAADLSDMFQCGVYDTKYIAEFHQSVPATYLDYLYTKMQLKNAHREVSGKWHVRVTFPPYPSNLANVDWYPYLQIHSYDSKSDDDGLEVCETFAYHGWCSKGSECGSSHNINKIVIQLQPKGAKKSSSTGRKYSGPKTGSLVHIIQHAVKKEEMENKKRINEDLEPDRKKNKICSIKSGNERNGNDEPGQDHNSDSKSNNQDSKKAGSHKAGYDAFMTGFIFASYIAEKGVLSTKNTSYTADSLGLSEEKNKMYLVGKNIPFLIRTSAYANMSTNHMSKIAKIRKDCMR
ncbi:target of EGR1 protein 1 isoform X1 [Penaeus vannamei]|uniref:target of EGR1 protein 1 isoform X1 n=2 Tax=Penaeus vannamei TaxID=6689 RepID=UPI00387F3EB4